MGRRRRLNEISEPLSASTGRYKLAVRVNETILTAEEDCEIEADVYTPEANDGFNKQHVNWPNKGYRNKELVTIQESVYSAPEEHRTWRVKDASWLQE